LRALAKVTPAALKMLQDKELARITELLVEIIGQCGNEQRERPQKKKVRR
jgi:hypothetical protein